MAESADEWAANGRINLFGQKVQVTEMQSEADAIFALNNGAVIAGQKNWTQVRAAVLTMDRDWLDLKERFSITDEFVEQHREPVTNFLLRGGSAMVRALYGYLQGDDKAIEALRRIVQAELTGGNLTLLHCLRSSVLECKHQSSILFMEDVGENLYSIDRMLQSLKLTDKFQNFRDLLSETLQK